MSTSVVSAKNGSMLAVVGSGIRHMSDSWIAFQPAIDEPSNICPSAKVSSLMIETSKVTCCHLPRGSVKRKSTNFTSLSWIIFMTFFGVVMASVPFVLLVNDCSCRAVLGRARASGQASRSNGIDSGFPRPDPDRFFDAGDEDLSVADAPGLGGATDCIDGLFDHVVGEHDLDFHLGQEVNHVLCPAIKFGVPLLATKALGFSDGDALQADFLESLLDLVQLERLDDRLDFLHRILPPGSLTGHPLRNRALR